MRTVDKTCGRLPGTVTQHQIGIGEDRSIMKEMQNIKILNFLMAEV